MEFTVPQFTEYDPTIIGPLSFKQFIVVATAGIICLVIFYKSPSLLVSIPLIIIISGGTLALLFLKIGGRSPLIVLKNAFFFKFSPKIYLWKRKIIPTKIIRREEIIEETKKGPVLKIVEKSRLKDLSAKLETRKRR